MPQTEKIPEFVLVDDNNNRYVAQRGWTTQKKYAKRFIKEDAEEKSEISALNGYPLIMEPAEDDE